MYKKLPNAQNPRSSGMNSFPWFKSIGKDSAPDSPLVVEVEGLIRSATPDELRLAATDVDILE